jgi:hypothetical protein
MVFGIVPRIGRKIIGFGAHTSITTAMIVAKKRSGGFGIVVLFILLCRVAFPGALN